jgi:hypothetical protein
MDILKFLGSILLGIVMIGFIGLLFSGELSIKSEDGFFKKVFKVLLIIIAVICTIYMAGYYLGKFFSIDKMR